MNRASFAVVKNQKRKKLLESVKGFRGRRKNCGRLAYVASQKALLDAYKDRRLKKRTFRSLWIIRINAGLAQLGLKYSRFMHSCKLYQEANNVELPNRKMLAQLAYTDISAFNKIAQTVCENAKG
jgi:large subunit ribosomal protein L20